MKTLQELASRNRHTTLEAVVFIVHLTLMSTVRKEYRVLLVPLGVEVGDSAGDVRVRSVVLLQGFWRNLMLGSIITSIQNVLCHSIINTVNSLDVGIIHLVIEVVDVLLGGIGVQGLDDLVSRVLATS